MATIRRSPVMNPLVTSSQRPSIRRGLVIRNEIPGSSTGKIRRVPVLKAAGRVKLPGRRAPGSCKAAKRNDDEDDFAVIEKDASVPQELQFGEAPLPPTEAKIATSMQQQQPPGADRARLPSQIRVLKPGDEIAGGRYRVIEDVGSGSNAVTYKAVTAEGVEVAVKMMSLRGMKDWKQLQLFEREAATLRTLSHPSIPKYLEYFEDDTEDDKAFFLVQELAPGKSLAQLSAEGAKMTEAKVMDIARQLLEVLEYLSNLRPPVVHRDVKPENIIIDGDVVRLVDFGGVQEASLWGEGMPLGSTIVGTYGYMAPEQFRGAAQPASDLYALGGTLLYLLSGQPPSSFPQQRLRIDFSSRVAAGPVLQELLTGLLEPLPEDRLTASDALDVLSGKRVRRQENQQAQAQTGQALAPPSRSGKKLRKPAGTRVKVTKMGTSTVIEIPPAKPGADTVGSSIFAVTWNLFVGFWTAGALAGGGLIFAAFSAPFWYAGYELLRGSFGAFLSKSTLRISPKAWSLQKQLALLQDGNANFAGDGSTIAGDTRDLNRAQVKVGSYVNDEAQTELTIYEGANKHTFGESVSYQEQEWLAEVINEAITRANSDESGYDSDDYDDEDLR